MLHRPVLLLAVRDLATSHLSDLPTLMRGPLTEGSGHEDEPPRPQLTLATELPCGAELGFGHDSIAAADPALIARGLQAGPGTFDHELSFHLGQRGHDVEEEAPGGHGGVDRVGEADEAYPAFVQGPGNDRPAYRALRI